MPAADTPPSPRAVERRRATALDLSALIAEGQPVVIEGIARDWPLVRAALASPRAAADMLIAHDAGLELTGYIGAPEIGGRFHYDATATALNFTAERMRLPEFLTRVIDGAGQADAPSLYLGSTDIDAYLPGLRAANDLITSCDTFARHAPTASIWIGNRTTAATHYDMSNNVAICVAGHRRFTLFPPEQVANLYPGPLAPTPGGQVVSMVDLSAPDLTRYPRFEEALASAQVAELSPGDAVIYPALWWHNVEALSDFNILINYWWNQAAAHLDTPMDTLLHALLSLRDRPMAEKAAWREMFDYYVFGDAERPRAHLPDAAQGPLAPLDAMNARRLRAYLLNRLNR